MLMNLTIIYRTIVIKKIPIYLASANEQNFIASIVDEILKQKNNNSEIDTSTLEYQIDQIVYKLYGLTEDDIRIVEESN